MQEINKAFYLGRQSNPQFKNYRLERAMSKKMPHQFGVVSSIVIAFFIFLGLAFFLSFLNKSIESKNSLQSQKLSPESVEISLRV